MIGSRIGSVLIAGVGIAHLVPATAMLSRRRVEHLYGITVADSDVELLLRHRATFFGLLGVMLLVGAARARYRLPAAGAGALSLVSYIGLARCVGASNEELTQVMYVDIGLLGALAASVALTK